MCASLAGRIDGYWRLLIDKWRSGCLSHCAALPTLKMLAGNIACASTDGWMTILSVAASASAGGHNSSSSLISSPSSDAYRSASQSLFEGGHIENVRKAAVGLGVNNLCWIGWIKTKVALVLCRKNILLLQRSKRDGWWFVTASALIISTGVVECEFSLYICIEHSFSQHMATFYIRLDDWRVESERQLVCMTIYEHFIAHQIDECLKFILKLLLLPPRSGVACGRASNWPTGQMGTHSAVTNIE